MRRMKVPALLVLTLIILAGCPAFFDFNVFESLDTPPAPKLSDYQGLDGLAKLADDLSSPAVVARLKDDPTVTAQIESYLLSTYGVTTPPLDSPEKRTAAALYSDLLLKTTSGDELVNNIVSAIVMSPPTGTIASIISSIIPTDVADNETKFTAMVNGLLAANVAYLTLGAGIHVYGVPPGMNMGDIAQKAAVAFLMQAVVDEIVSQTVYTPQEAIAQMYLLTNNQANGIGMVTMGSDPLNPLDINLQYIFDAAGAPLPA